MSEDIGRLFAFGPLKRPVRFLDGAEAMLDWLPRLATGWLCYETDAGTRAPSELVARLEGEEFVIEAPWLDAPVRETESFRAAANLAVDLVEACLDENPDLVAVHCAAAEIDGRAVLFPAGSRAGKSTLAARLAAEGLPVLGDDVLALSNEDEPAAMSFGLHPRLRLPLPDHAGAPFREFVQAHVDAADEHYAYLRLPHALAPRFGRTAPLGAVVLLERMPHSGTTLVPIGRGDGLQQLLLQNLSPRLAMGDALPRLAQALTGTPCLRLTYWDLDEAAARLAGLFADDAFDPPEPAGDTEIAPAPRGQPRRLEIGRRFVHRVGITREAVDDGAFLIDRETGAVFRLNAVSSAMWTLMERPVSLDLCAAMIAEAFPDVDEHRVIADVEAHLIELARAGLIVDGTVGDTMQAEEAEQA